MSQIKIVTDSTSDLPAEVLKKYNIEVVPLTISIDGESYEDGVDITPEEFLDKMADSRELPKSSQPPAGAFLEAYKKLGADGSRILSIHMTAGLSGTVRSAESAAGMAEEDVTVWDSNYISRGLGFQVVEAAQMAEQGKSMEEILERLDYIRSHTRLYIMVDTLDNLVKGGRVGKVNAFLGSLLNIKPIALLEEGVLQPLAKARSGSQVVKYLTRQFTEDFNSGHIKGVGVAHARGEEIALKVIDSITRSTGIEDVSLGFTTPIVSTHTGAGAFALMYYFD
ncbi:DegV family protein [Peribacillus sp. SCS-37]|uniref:DegV family protein n=1 Tax=Paraperibacillus esterisolvens TaxID=3115296 RepID=UPI00390663B0